MSRIAAGGILNNPGNAPGLLDCAVQVGARIPMNTPAGAFMPPVLEIGGVRSRRNLWV